MQSLACRRPPKGTEWSRQTTRETREAHGEASCFLWLLWLLGFPQTLAFWSALKLSFALTLPNSQCLEIPVCLEHLTACPWGLVRWHPMPHIWACLPYSHTMPLQCHLSFWVKEVAGHLSLLSSLSLHNPIKFSSKHWPVSSHRELLWIGIISACMWLVWSDNMSQPWQKTLWTSVF